MTWLDISVAVLTMLVGATLQGSVGFGMGLLASPILILIDPRFVPAPILLATLVLTTFMTWRERHAVDTSGLRWAIVGRVFGTTAAATVLAVLPQDRLSILFGSLVLLAVLMSVSGLRFRPERSVLIVAGALSGDHGDHRVDRWPPDGARVSGLGRRPAPGHDVELLLGGDDDVARCAPAGRSIRALRGVAHDALAAQHDDGGI